jgi:hypothetical protein
MFWGKTYYLSRVTGVEIVPCLRFECSLSVKAQNRLTLMRTVGFVSSVRIAGGLPGNRKEP